MPTAALLPAIVAGLPETAALVDVRSGRRYSRDDIWRAVLDRAAALAASGVERGDAVVVGQPEGAPFILDVFAAWTAGMANVSAALALDGPAETARD